MNLFVQARRAESPLKPVSPCACTGGTRRALYLSIALPTIHHYYYYCYYLCHYCYDDCYYYCHYCCHDYWYHCHYHYCHYYHCHCDYCYWQ